MTTAKDVLVGTRALLSDKTKWTQEVFARDPVGTAVNLYSPLAACWCLEGAIGKVSSELGTGMGAAADLLRKQLPDGTSLIDWNDSKERTYQDVVDLLDKAIAEAS